MAGLLKRIPARLRPHPSDVTAGTLWGVTFVTAALYMIEPWDWIKQQLSKSDEEEQK